MSVNGATGTKAHPVAGQYATLFRDIFAGLIASTISIAYGLSFAALIFAPPLTPRIAYGIAATFLTTRDQRRIRCGAKFTSFRARGT